MPLDLNLPDTAATAALGAALAAGAGPGQVLHLSGDLGTGKTTLVRGLLRALGYAGRVKSPTYSKVEPYEVSSLHFYHFDLYRLTDKSEWAGTGFREYFNAQSMCVVEWPERAAGLLTPPDVEVRLQMAGDGRRVHLAAHTPVGEAWLSSLRLSG
jgi:tRNA threonylcarbamoyladenosine biosynthesis protein TsaE